MLSRKERAVLSMQAIEDPSAAKEPDVQALQQSQGLFACRPWQLIAEQKQLEKLIADLGLNYRQQREDEKKLINIEQKQVGHFVLVLLNCRVLADSLRSGLCWRRTRLILGTRGQRSQRAWMKSTKSSAASIHQSLYVSCSSLAPSLSLPYRSLCGVLLQVRQSSGAAARQKPARKRRK